MPDIEYLLDIDSGVYQSLQEADNLACTWPSSSVTSSRKAIELALKHWHRVRNLNVPEGISGGLASPEFRAGFSQEFLNLCYLVRDAGNAGAHGSDEIIDEFSIKVFELACTVIGSMLPRTATPGDPKEGDQIEPTQTLSAQTGPLPPWETICQWNLTPGHLYLIEKLCDAWFEWAIYVESHTYGYKPDVVAIHPKYGIYIFEVKDYNLDCYRYAEDKFMVRSGNDGKWYRTKCPIEQVSRVRTALSRGPLNGIPDQVCKTVLYIHGPNFPEVRRVFGPRIRENRLGESDPILLSTDTLEVFLSTQQHTISNEYPARYRDVLAVLAPSEHRLGQWSRIKLRPKQEAAAKTRWDQKHDVTKIQLDEQEDLFGEGVAREDEANLDKSYFRRFRAPAGAGKSLVLCDRAARACSHGKRTLICCFNLTLVNYLYEIVTNRTPKDCRTNFAVRNFHGLVVDLQVEFGLRIAKETKRGGPVTTKEYREPTLEELNSSLEFLDDKTRYDAIYVDEVQDFDPSWLKFLVALLNPGGEMVLAGDLRQDIYGRKGGDGHGLPFKGRWRQIADISERTPPTLVPFLNDFAQTHALGDKEDHRLAPKQVEMEFGNLMLWKNYSTDDELVEAATKVVRYLMRKHQKTPEAIALLVPTHPLGSSLVQSLANAFGDETVQDVFGEEHRQKKKTFYMGGGKFKASTIHSFKGWDIENVVLLWRHTSEENSSLLYTALTRAKMNIFVLNSDSAFYECAASFPRQGQDA